MCCFLHKKALSVNLTFSPPPTKLCRFHLKAMQVYAHLEAPNTLTLFITRSFLPLVEKKNDFSLNDKKYLHPKARLLG